MEKLEKVRYATEKLVSLFMLIPQLFVNNFLQSVPYFLVDEKLKTELTKKK